MIEEKAIQEILDWIDGCGIGVMHVVTMRDLAAAYREKCEELQKAHDLLWDVMCSGVTDPFLTCDYVEVQIDKGLWIEIAEALKKERDK